MADVPDIVPRPDFEQAIAFLLPGVPLLRAVAYISPSVERLWVLAFEGNASAGAYLLFVMMLLTAGLSVSSVRSTLEDLCLLLPPIGRRWGLDYGLMSDEKRPAFEEAIRHVYRYAQFNGNMALALIILLLVRAHQIGFRWDGTTSLVTSATLIFLLCALVSFGFSRSTLRQILGQE